MITFESLPITAADENRKKTFEFSGKQFKLRLRKNNIDSSFSMDVFDLNDVFIYNSKLNYGVIFGDSISADLPFKIIPLDISQLTGNLNAETEITPDNLGVTVNLFTSIKIS